MIQEMTNETPKRRGRPARPDGPTAIARLMNEDRRSSPITSTLALARMRAVGNTDLADEIKAELERAALLSKRRYRAGWMSGLEFVARFQPDHQRWAWEELRKNGARWLKRYVECQRNPPTASTIADRLANWLDREFPGVEHETTLEALHEVASWLTDNVRSEADR